MAFASPPPPPPSCVGFSFSFSCSFRFTSSSSCAIIPSRHPLLFFLPTSRRRQQQRPLQHLHVGNHSPYSYSFVTSARRRRKHSSSTTSPPPKHNKESLQLDNEGDDDLDEDAFEALFTQLEEDLKNDDLSANDGGDEVTEEDLAMLEKELADALGDEDYDEFSASLPSLPDTIDTDDEEREERHPKLKNWQLRRLAATLKIGRRKTNIKGLAAELGLDRAFVLELLRDPPPSLLLLSASLPNTIKQRPVDIEDKLVESPLIPVSEPAKIDSEVKAPIHVVQSRWSAQKRLKKVQVEVLERVYFRTKRPTNAMISSIIQVTNLPWKRVVKWFEDKRAEDGILDKRVPFHRQASERL